MVSPGNTNAVGDADQSIAWMVREVKEKTGSVEQANDDEADELPAGKKRRTSKGRGKKGKGESKRPPQSESAETASMALHVIDVPFEFVYTELGKKKIMEVDVNHYSLHAKPPVTISLALADGQLKVQDSSSGS